MVSDSTVAGERLLLPGVVAARFLTRLDNVYKWVAEGRLRGVQTPKGLRVPEGAVEEFEREAHRRENYNGFDHGLHSWPEHEGARSSLPVPAQNAQELLDNAPRWPFPHG